MLKPVLDLRMIDSISDPIGGSKIQVIFTHYHNSKQKKKKLLKVVLLTRKQASGYATHLKYTKYSPFLKVLIVFKLA